ncbi:Imm51 family immunity protein [Xanthocytophaga agilis]|uniref:Imm51 family immunity protein n=1 Tax=Xanthocytophaga agilis TaxID=3048010 RepID=A0AAE3UJM1_9BACT|nr:Imm51 family immunity protein [Xanthocytophaga agilis]MDJ1505383.1 Imm51 family immunity protein [Xanthocytophaga agilis]
MESEHELFPCVLHYYEDTYSIELSSTDTHFFFDLLEEYELYGNGPCWEGLIEQILERDMPDILPLVDFDSEADACLLILPSEEIQHKIANHLHVIFTNETRFREYLQSIDKDRIDA